MQLQRTTLAEQLTELLKSAIFSGELKPGATLVEARLATRFGVSRGPLREAIQALTDQGLVTSEPFGGSQVVSLTPKDVNELFGVRAALEMFAFEQVWSKREEAFYAEMKGRHAALLQAIDNGDDAAAIVAELYLHSYVYEATGNRLLLHMWRSLEGRLQLYWAAHHYVHGRRGPLREGHDAYVLLACGTDLAAMLSEVRLHIELGQQKTLEFLQKLHAASGAQV